MSEQRLSVFVKCNPQLLIALAHGTEAQYLNSNTSASFLCFTEHGGQQRGLSTAHMSDHSDKRTLWHMDVDPVSKEMDFPLGSISFYLDLVIFISSFYSQLLPFKTRRAFCRPAESAIFYHHIFPIYTRKNDE